MKPVMKPARGARANKSRVKLSVVTTGAGYVGSDAAAGVQLDGAHPGFVGCLQDVLFDHQLLIPDDVLSNPDLAQNVQVRGHAGRAVQINIHSRLRTCTVHA